MEYKYKFSQGILRRLHEDAMERMKLHPEFAAKYQSIIQEHPHFKTEKEALEAAFKIEKDNPYTCQIWVKIEQDEDFYQTQDWWIVTSDWKVLQAAEYIGMVQIYDETKLRMIIKKG